MHGNFSRDVRYGLRLLLRNPGFTSVAVLVLALGIGATTAIFSLTDTLLWKPLPLENPDELVWVFTSLRRNSHATSSYPSYRYYKEENETLSGLAASFIFATSLKADRPAEQVWAVGVSDDYFDVLGIAPKLGKVFHAPRTTAPAQPTHSIVLGRAYWEQRFGSSTEVLGTTVFVNGHPLEVIGVIPKEFEGMVPGIRSDFYLPIEMINRLRPGHDWLGSNGRWLQMIGRLKPGVSLDQARAQMDVLAARLSAAFPEEYEDRGVSLVPVHEGHPDLRGEAAGISGFLLATVALVFLIACANVATLLLTRSATRTREMAIRAALGAGRFRIARQLLTESVLLTLLGGAAGLLVAVWVSEIMQGVRPPFPAPIGLSLGLDWRVLLSAFLAAVAAGCLAGMAPAIQSMRLDLIPAIKGTDTKRGASGSPWSLRNLFVITQIALSAILLMAGGLMLRSLWGTYAADPGFTLRNGFQIALDPGQQGYGETEGRRFFRDLRDRTEALPGVASVMLTHRVPLGMGSRRIPLWSEDQFQPGGEPEIEARHYVVTPGYFETIGTPLLAGRDFASSDREGAPPVAIINRALAEKLWAERSPLGQRLQIGLGGAEEEPILAEVIGVAAGSKYVSWNDDAEPHLFLPLEQNYRSDLTLIARTLGDPNSPLLAARGIVEDLDPHLAAIQAMTTEEHLRQSRWMVRTGLTLFGALGLAGVLVAAIGLYGVLAYSVTQRTREIAIRLAVGAQPRDVLKLVIRESLGLGLAGLVVGLPVAVAATRILSVALVGIETYDPFALVGTALFLTLVVLLASTVPALRAMRTDPMDALRFE